MQVSTFNFMLFFIFARITMWMKKRTTNSSVLFHRWARKTGSFSFIRWLSTFFILGVILWSTVARIAARMIAFCHQPLARMNCSIFVKRTGFAPVLEFPGIELRTYLNFQDDYYGIGFPWEKAWFFSVWREVLEFLCHDYFCGNFSIVSEVNLGLGKTRETVTLLGPYLA